LGDNSAFSGVNYDIIIKSEKRIGNNETYWVLEIDSLTSPSIVGIRLENCEQCDLFDTQTYCTPPERLVSGHQLTCKPFGGPRFSSQALLSCWEGECKLSIVGDHVGVVSSGLATDIFQIGKEATFKINKKLDVKTVK